MKIRYQPILCLSTLAVGLLLAGCTALPGLSLYNPKATADVARPNPVEVSIVPVTPEIIQQLETQLMPYHYYVEPSDVITITVWDHPEFSSFSWTDSSNSGGVAGVASGGGASSTNAASTTNGYLIDSDGTIQFPVIGRIQVAGLNIRQIADLMTQKLSVYIKNPQVMVQVSSFASQQIYMMGEINLGAGGAAVTAVPVTDKPMTLALALAEAGGMNVATANTNAIYVIRGSSSMTHPTVYWFDAESPAAMTYAQRFPLMSNDVVFVSPAGLTRINRVISQIMPTVQTIWYTKTLINPNN